MPCKKHRQPAPRSRKFGGRLVTSVHEQHSARGLCENDYSYGPDFVSFSENVFCDMETKQQWPLCDGGRIEEGCYDLTTHSLNTRPGHLKRNHVLVENWD